MPWSFLLVACTVPAGDSAGPHRDGEPDTADSADTADTADSADSADSAVGGGPCAAYGAAVATGTVADPTLDELSGLAASRLNPGVLWTHEDSGGAPELYALDPTGQRVATLTLDGVTNTDWEDLAVAECAAGWCLHVGDIGTLGTDRDTFAVLTVPEPLLSGASTLTATPEVRTFRYPEGPEDAEALAVDAEGRPLVMTKRTDATTQLYRLDDGADVLTPLATLATGPSDEDLAARVTAADLWLDPPRLLVRTYFHLYEVDLTAPEAPGDPVELAAAVEFQGEAVAWAPDGGFWQVSEWQSPTLWHTPCAEATP